jgi:hypothetical protein
MGVWARHRLRHAALKIVEQAPEGLSVDALKARLAERFPKARRASIDAIATGIDLHFAPRIARRGQWLSHRSQEGVRPTLLFSDPIQREQSVIPQGAKEEDYYAPLIAFLRDKLESAYRFINLGAETIGKQHWTYYNPDLIGLSAHAGTLGALVPPELLAVEVKINDKNPLDYLIQPLSYRVYAHRAILACRPPDQPNRKALLEARCAFYGIGLIYISGKPAPEAFRVRLQPAYGQPSIPALGEFLERLKAYKAKPELFTQLTEPSEP